MSDFNINDVMRQIRSFDMSSAPMIDYMVGSQDAECKRLATESDAQQAYIDTRCEKILKQRERRRDNLHELYGVIVALVIVQQWYALSLFALGAVVIFGSIGTQIAVHRRNMVRAAKLRDDFDHQRKERIAYLREHPDEQSGPWKVG